MKCKTKKMQAGGMTAPMRRPELPAQARAGMANRPSMTAPPGLARAAEMQRGGRTMPQKAAAGSRAAMAYKKGGAVGKKK